VDYPGAIAYLHSLTDYEKTRIERYTADTLDLSRVERLLAAVDTPHKRYPVVHIAGTKGKGSTAAMIEACLRAAGYRTGFYTSPHLHTFRERIQVGGKTITRDEVVTLVEEIQPLLEEVPEVTTFEAITALGFLYFARMGVEIAVVEVGLGGRLDATNVVTPVVSVITSLSLDHTYLLGDTLAEIAYEKAGIIKPNVPVVSAPQKQSAADVIRRISGDRNAPLVQVGRDWHVTPGAADLDGQQVGVRSQVPEGSDLTGEYWIPLLGRHQLENVGNAVAALDVLRQQGFSISPDVVRRGLSTVSWPGRLEILSRAPLVVVDCAHNPYSMQVLSKALDEWFPDQRWVVVFGASADKDIAGMLSTLLPRSVYNIVTRSDHPRAAAPSELADIFARSGSGAEILVNVPKALKRGLELVEPGTGLLVTGSIFVVADAREDWAHYSSNPVPENDG
jgi:dihydrofolate synthase / folylpolyglutamate synthase